ncbi:hypothetical protein V8E54_001452 [Elaphomyces granulatus]
MREEFFLVLQKLQTLLFSRLTIIEHLKPRYSIWLDIWVFRSRWTDNELGYEYMIEVFDRATAARTNTDLIQLSFARSKINSTARSNKRRNIGLEAERTLNCAYDKLQEARPALTPEEDIDEARPSPL